MEKSKQCKSCSVIDPEFHTGGEDASVLNNPQTTIYHALITMLIYTFLRFYLVQNNMYIKLIIFQFKEVNVKARRDLEGRQESPYETTYDQDRLQ